MSSLLVTMRKKLEQSIIDKGTGLIKDVADALQIVLYEKRSIDFPANPTTNAPNSGQSAGLPTGADKTQPPTTESPETEKKTSTV